jgi:capsular exopolysaccharide synthesis family protein
MSAASAPRVILVTSAQPGDGKTTISSNAAILLARQHKRVLLIEADFHRPTIGSSFRLEPGPGFASVLRDQCDFEHAVQRSAAVPDLFILKAAPIAVGEDADLLASRFPDLIREWRTQFDHVVIDTPPVLGATDALMLSAYVDSVLLVVRCGHTTAGALLHVQTLLKNVKANVAGVVLNGADFDAPEFSHYGYSYGYSDPNTAA